MLFGVQMYRRILSFGSFRRFLIMAPVALWISERILFVNVDASGVTFVTVSPELTASVVADDLLVLDEASASAFSVSTVSCRFESDT